MVVAIESKNAPARTVDSGWVIHTADEVESTNTLAGQLPAWNAVRARTQSGGRGRTGNRRWISDDGGLWLSAVVPCPGARGEWAILPLAAGWATLSTLRDFGIADARLRWPNDIMVGRRKLAGLLVERFTPDTAVIGIGINIFNRPECAEPTLDGQTTRLADLVPSIPSLDNIARLILAALRRTHALLITKGFSPIAEELNREWTKPTRIEVTLTGQVDACQGLFCGIDRQGRLRVTTDRHGAATYDAAQVALLRELE